MALDAVSLMRARVRGTPSWPGHDPETGYVGADRSDHSQKLLADGAGHTFLDPADLDRLRQEDLRSGQIELGPRRHAVSPPRAVKLGVKPGESARIAAPHALRPRLWPK